LPLATVGPGVASGGVSATVATHALEEPAHTEADAGSTLQRGMDDDIPPGAPPSQEPEALPHATAPDKGRSSGRRKRLLRLAATCLIVLALSLVMALWATHFRSGSESAVTSLAQANDTLEQGHLFYSQGRLDEAL